jgi:signal transduction histidine kinase
MQSDAASALTEIELPIDADQLAAVAAESDAPSPFSVYDRTGQLVYGEGPTLPDEPTLAALAGRTAHNTNGDIIVAAPITDSGEHVVGALRMVDARGGTDGRVRSAWAVMLLSAAVAIGVAWLIARRLARRLTAPIEQLAQTATDLGRGAAHRELPRSGIEEIDAVADALNDSSTRISEAIARERRFSSDVSHQLRTPLAGVRLKLEAPHVTDEASGLAAAALADLDRVDTTVTHLLAIARDATPHAEPAPVDAMIRRANERWQVPIALAGREAAWRIGTEQMVYAGNSIDQIVDVLIDNALRHGIGAVTVTARSLGGAVAIDVADEGHLADILTDERLFRRGEGDGHGIGLALARSLAVAEGGRLLLTSRHPTTFTLFLPTSWDG